MSHSRSAPLPPNAADGVFTVSGSSIINAPVETVWRVLLDLEGYKEWNAFVREQIVTDPTGKPLPHHPISEGRHMSISVHLPPSLRADAPFYQKSSAFVLCTYRDDDAHRVAWRTVTPRWLLDAERWQSLEVVHGQDGEGLGSESDTVTVKYQSVEVFKGVLAYFVRFFVGAKLVLGVEAMAQGLKARAEAEAKAKADSQR